MFLHPISLVLFSISALSPHAPAPASPAPLTFTQIRPAAIPSNADELVDRLVRNAAALDATLPSITAHEVVQTYASRRFHRQQTRSEGMVQVVRIASAGTLTETHQMTAHNGKPVASDDRAQTTQPSDGFIAEQEMFFSPSTRPCFTFTLAPQPTQSDPLQLHIALSPEYASLAGCPSGLQGLTGIARVDPATHKLIHLERTIPTQAGSPISFVSTDYAPASVGDKTFWLPDLTISTGAQGKSSVYTAVYYSDYHQYAATVTVLTAASQ
jgi:hypothetical protein